MPNSRGDKKDVFEKGAEKGPEGTVRENVKKAVDWLLVPAATGSIANIAAMALSGAIGRSAVPFVVAAAVLGAAAAKYYFDEAKENKQDKR